MASEKHANNLTGKPDPTVKSGSAPEYPEGSHPIAPLADQDWSAQNKEYRENPDKPDPTTVAQVEIVPESKGR